MASSEEKDAGGESAGKACEDAEGELVPSTTDGAVVKAKRGRPSKKMGTGGKEGDKRIDRYFLRGNTKSDEVGSGNEAFVSRGKLVHTPIKQTWDVRVDAGKGLGGVNAAGGGGTGSDVDWNSSDEEGLAQGILVGEEVDESDTRNSWCDKEVETQEVNERESAVITEGSLGDGDVPEKGEQRNEKRKRIADLERRLMEFWKTESAKIIGAISPMPCRCEQMNTIIGNLLKEADMARMQRWTDKAVWEEEKAVLMATIESLERKKETGRRNRRPAESNSRPQGNKGGGVEECERLSDISSGSLVSDVNNNECTVGGSEGQMQVPSATNKTGSDRADKGAGDYRLSGERPGAPDDEEAPTYQSLADLLPSNLRQQASARGRSWPAALSETEWRKEVAERLKRKNNIIVKGLRRDGNKDWIAQEVTRIMRSRLGVDPRIRNVKWQDGMTVVTVESRNSKKEIMRRRGELRQAGIRVEDDLSTREKEVEDWLQEEAGKKVREGKAIVRGYMKLWVDGVWYYWVERESRLEKVSFPFRGEK